MKRTGIIIALTLAGCAARPPLPEATPVTHIPSRGGWYCQPAATPGAWDCVQDPDLATNPPSPRPLPAPMAAPEPTPVPTVAPLISMLEPVAGPAADTDADGSDAGESRDGAAQRRLAELPPEQYTIQLVAMDTRRALEPLLARSDLDDAFVARIERDGVLYYVLLVGVYATERQARQAADALADDLRALSPWVRSVRGLQAAEGRARALEASGAV